MIYAEHVDCAGNIMSKFYGVPVSQLAALSVTTPHSALLVEATPHSGVSTTIANAREAFEFAIFTKAVFS